MSPCASVPRRTFLYTVNDNALETVYIEFEENDHCGGIDESLTNDTYTR